MPEDDACSWEDCPGSDLYIYEGNDKLHCCGCLLAEDDSDFVCDTANEMNAHILVHDAKGHHVRKSLLAVAKGIPVRMNADET